MDLGIFGFSTSNCITFINGLWSSGEKKSQGRLKAGLYFLIKSPILFIGTFFIKNNICSVAKKYDVFFFCACILIAHVSCKVELWLAYISKGDKSLNI